MNEVFDMHSHLDFASQYISVAKEAEAEGIRSLCSTILPTSYISAHEALLPYENIHVALGLHPWWIGESRVGENELNQFSELAKTTNLIGEIGLDFHIKHKDSIEKQVEDLYFLLQSIVEAGNGKLITLHSVRSANKILDMLDEQKILDNNTCIFHWFQGTEDDFGRALSKGCYFSVGMRMLATDAGRVFASAIPDSNLLIESDSPAHEGSVWSADVWAQELDNTMCDLAKLREVSPDQIRELTLDNSNSLINGFI